jgi:hypothetical protein
MNTESGRLVAELINENGQAARRHQAKVNRTTEEKGQDE